MARRGRTSPIPASDAPDKVEATMHEFKHGTLHSGSKKGPKVSNRKQAVAIALSQQRKANAGRS
jgi:Family of unknown function (DUF6496)